jgi:plastocyanin
MKRAAAIVVSLVGLSCGGGSAPSTPTPVPSNPFTFTITSSGVSPKEFTVPPGTRVLFVNNDSRSHAMSSDPHPEHTDCPAVNSVGTLASGQNRETGNLNDVRTCGFHDHDNPDNANLKGRIIIR